MRIAVPVIAFWLAAFSASAATEGRLDTAAIERLTGVKGTWNDKEKVFRVAVPRTDLSVTSGGVRLTPPMGLTSWAAFQSTPGGTMVMGDLVLREVGELRVDRVNEGRRLALGGRRATLNGRAGQRRNENNREGAAHPGIVLPVGDPVKLTTRWS